MITFLPDDRRAPERVGRTIYDVALSAGININSLCGGLGTCGKCKVIVRAGRGLLSEATDVERSFLSESDMDAGYRLACQARVLNAGQLTVFMPFQTKNTAQRLQVEGLETKVRLSPSVRKAVVRVPPPALDDARSDLDSIGRAYRGIDSVGFSCLRSLPSALRNNSWEVALILYERELISVAGPGARALGFAVDLGSTKLAGYLLDLESGATISKVSRLNPQIPFGEDIVTRTTQVIKDERNLSLLRAVLLKAVNEMIEEACASVGASKADVYEVVAVGNTFMHHTFLGINPVFLSRSPYPPAVSSELSYSAAEVGVRAGEGARVYILPNRAGYIGADCIADVLSTGLYKRGAPSLLIDIGTNTEIALSDGDRIYVASAASGPAFEGACLLHGMRAMDGAIEGVAMDAGCENIYFSTIGQRPPIGICGSGAIDVVAELLKVGALERSGRFSDAACPRFFRDNGRMKEFVLVGSASAGAGDDLTITQRDIREIQKAKGAVATGIRILMKRAGLRASDLDVLFMAGAFGTYLDPSSTKRIGMIPDIPLNRIQQVGNSAGTGARMCVLSRSSKEAAGRIPHMMEYVELAAEGGFQAEYMRSLALEELDC